ncbi:MAG: T9SS type A sorting domain-containing protein [Candidatus Electryonea clarkiae]|nr:T9SS type A sorting domain-containing protein [Candidatus Electryonea clarkiae]MDP8289071.1 T9SS type A sorting domain-containing protein [Candidatus Electryonea clarkiae]
MSNPKIVTFLFILLSLAVYKSSKADILYVPQDFELIQSAIDSSDIGDTIIVSPDEYEVELLISEHGLTLASEFLLDEDSTNIESTELQGGDGFRPLTIDSTVQGVVNIIGLSFTSGHVDGGEREDQGGAINAMGVEIILRDNIISSNWARFVGGVFLYQCSGRIINNRFENNRGNSSTGGLMVNNGEYYISGNKFIANYSGFSGGGMNASGSQLGCRVEISDNLFRNNFTEYFGGALFLLNQGAKIVENNIIIENEARQGGGLYTSRVDTIIIRHNQFRENIANEYDNNLGFGAAIVLGPTILQGEIDHNAFLFNQADFGGGAIVFGDDCIFHHNVFIENRGGYNGVIATLVVNNSHANVTGYNNLFTGNGPLEGFHEYTNGISAKRFTSIRLHSNDFISNEDVIFGYADNHREDDELIVINNYWGDDSGPDHQRQNQNGTGDLVDPRVNVLPFSTERFTDFEAPDEFELLSPADNDTNERPQVRFTWASTTAPNEDDTIKYTLLLSLREDFSDAERYFSNTDTTIIVLQFQFENTYFWKVYAEDNMWMREYSSETRQIFITNEELAPGLFDLASPVDSSIIEDDTIVFTWNPSVDFTIDEEVSYVLVITPVDNIEHPRSFRANQDTFKTINNLDLETVYRWQVYAEDNAGHRTLSNQSHILFYGNNVAVKQFEGIPKTWELSAVYPNPFNPVVRVVVGVPRTGIVKAEIFDLLGRSVAVLIDDKLNPGYHHLNWWAQGSSGVYFLRVSSESGWNVTRKLLFIR